jgi:hypothetical protein
MGQGRQSRVRRGLRQVGHAHADQFHIESENGIILDAGIALNSTESISNVKKRFQLGRSGNAFWGKNMLSEELDTLLA